MKLSYNWLSDFIDLSELKISDLADLLTMKTCEVEEYYEFRPELENFIIAEVRSVKKHPDADKLSICEVFTGDATLQIVTGAPNVRQGKKYPLASVGVTMPGGLAIKPAKLRGIDSNGMLCSSSELDLGHFVFDEFTGEEGLLTLPDTMTVGMSVRKALQLEDFILDIDNKSITHRPDLWGHYGFAREIASLTGKSIKSLYIEKINYDASVDDSLGKLTCSIENNSAIAYSWANITGVKIQASPVFIQARLIAGGMRPINNIVDFSNYVMLELGQPNHAFDRAKIGNTINAGFSKGGEDLELLDGRKVIIDSGIVLIKDGNRPVALGGVMGGKDTEVNETTTSLFLESATFHRKDIRKAVSSLGIRSEASQRFEKGQNPENSQFAIRRFITLLKESGQDLRCGKIESIATEQFRKNKIGTTISYIKQKLGSVDINADKIVSILSSLGMICNLSGDNLEVEVPVYRSYFDIEIPEDLVEEIGRIIGYNQINPEPVMVSCVVPEFHNKLRDFENILRNRMSRAYNYTEVYNYAFHSAADISLDTRHATSGVVLKNPIHKELEYLRISPLPGLIKNIDANHKAHSELKFYEIERIFLPREGSRDEKSLPSEKHFLAGISCLSTNADESLMSLLSMLTDILVVAGFPYYDQNREQNRAPQTEKIFHPGRAGEISWQNHTLAKWGELHPELSNKYNIPKRLYYFEIFLDDLVKLKPDINGSHYSPVRKYPAAEFEFTILADRKDLFSNLMNVVGIPKPVTTETFLESVEHLTTYVGESIPDGKKAVSVKVRWRNTMRTITSAELKTLQDNLIDRLAKASYHLRS